MGILGRLFGHDRNEDIPGLLPAIERAVSTVEPLLKQTGGYPEIYRKPVATALEYARSLAASIPGPVEINRESYASDPFVHSLFPSVDYVQDAFLASRALQDHYREYSSTDKLYALMGMRRFEKTVAGIELSGQTIQRDVIQNVVYFTSHTLEDLAPSENQSRDQAAWSLFDSLAGKVRKRVDTRKRDKHSQLQQKDSLIARLRTADAQTRPALEEELSKTITGIQSITSLLELRNYIEDFEAVLLNPEKHLRLNRIPMVLDRMGIRQDSGDTSGEGAITFNELVGFDRRDWTVTMVYCSNIPIQSFATRLDKACRELAI
ncbi:MAG: hypothetical protein HY936_02095 [Nitrosomonadales bacterium]|nr:hypothetical protein [Nitrosomonadales bacterium]